ncbi:hypothetical protein ACFS5M_14005 [Lacinutrix iliipiscaria]|uniref:Uncharacterized protein n=1 Tax=Lacinutrix iliipiscaria TaxID=1230532 RepID=A0ABW5WPV6_9FLAO
MKKFKALYAFMLAFFSAESLVEDGKINLSEDQKQKLQDALGPKTKLDDVVDAMNQELADAAAKDEDDTDQQLVDLKKEAMDMLKAHGLAAEDAEEAIEDPKKAAAESGDIKQILSGLLEHNKKTDKMLETLLKAPEEDTPLATGNRNNLKDMHSKTHFLGTGKAYDAFESRPWNQRAAGLRNGPTDFMAEDGTELQTLKGDIDLYHRQNPSAVNSLFRDLIGLPDFWTLVSNVDDKIATANIVSAEVSQARKLPYLAKNKQLIQPEENKVFPVQVDITHQGYFLQKIEASWLNMMNKEGSSPFKMSFVQFLLVELDKKVRQEDRKVAINGVFVKTPNNATVAGRAIHRGDGLLVQLWKAYWYDAKFRIANMGAPTTTNIVDYVKDVIENNIPEESKNAEGMVFYLSPYWMRRYKERKRQLFGLDNNYNGKEVNEIENYLNFRFVTLRDLEGSNFMFITDENNIKLYENKPGEKSMYRFQNILRDTHIFADYKWGAGFDHIGTKVKDTDPEAFKVQTVWANMPPYLQDMSVTLYDDATGEVALPYSNIHLGNGWSTNLDTISNTFAGQIVKIKGDTTSSGNVTDDGNITLTGDADWSIASGGTLTLLVNADKTLTEIKRTTTPATAPVADTSYVDSIDATNGSEFDFTGVANDVLDEILNGFEGQQIVVNGGAGGTVTINDVAGNIEVASEAVLADGADNITFVLVDGVWTEVARTIAA